MKHSNTFTSAIWPAKLVFIWLKNKRNKIRMHRDEISLTFLPLFLSWVNNDPCFFKLYKSKYEKVGVLPIRIVKSNVSSIGPSSERNEGPMLETLDFTIRIGSTPIFSYFEVCCVGRVEIQIEI